MESSVKRFMDKQGRIPLSAEEIAPLVKKANKGCIVSRNKIVEKNLGIIRKAAWKWYSVYRYNEKIALVKLKAMIQESQKPEGA